MPAPFYTGEYPVKLKEVFEFNLDGKRVYSLTQAWKNDVGVSYGLIGSVTQVDGLTYYEASNSSDAKGGIVETTRIFTYAPLEADSDEIMFEYECNASASEEPIATHPAFLNSRPDLGFYESIVTASGGYTTDGSASGGAVFNEEGVFIGFNSTATGNLAGVESYLSPQVTFKIKYSISQRPDVGLLEAIGTIRSPTAGPTIPASKSWLLTDVNWSNSGNGNDGSYDVSEGYRLSGDGGWNTLIYGS